MALRLHIFNPEHDIALAHGSPLFTSPRAGRQLRADLGFLPALWAGEESVVWTDQPQKAWQAVRRLGLDVPPGLFVDTPSLRRLARQVEAVDPWGWDAALCHQLQRLGVNPRILPTAEELEEVRALSHRRTAKELLDSIQHTSLTDNTIGDSIKEKEEVIETTSKAVELRGEAIELTGETIEPTGKSIELTGEAIEVKDEAALLQQLARWPEAVLKAPWSSSGRGVRMVSAPVHSSVLQWALGVMRRQGSLMVEPLYHKVADFGMEFSANAEGFTYLGLSLFDTSGTAYTGNVLATEEEKRTKLARYLSPTQIDSLRQLVLNCLEAISPRFRLGPFGIDMMIVRTEDGKVRVHPCVEINFRRTMGHVAIALQQRITTPFEAMAVTFEDGHYHLRRR